MPPVLARKHLTRIERHFRNLLMERGDGGWKAKKGKKRFLKCTSIHSRLCKLFSLLSVFNCVQVWLLPVCIYTFWINWMARGFFSRFVFIFILWNHLFLVCGYCGVEILVFLMKGIFFLITGTILVHVEIELFPGFGLIPSPACGSMESIMFVCIMVCVWSWHALSFNLLFFWIFCDKSSSPFWCRIPFNHWTKQMASTS